MPQELRIEARQQWAAIFAAIRTLEVRTGAAAASSPSGSATNADSVLGRDQVMDGGEGEVVDAMLLLSEGNTSEVGGTGIASGSSQGFSSGQAASSNPLSSLSVAAATQHLKAALCEGNPGIDGRYAKFLATLGPDEVKNWYSLITLEFTTLESCWSIFRNQNFRNVKPGR